MSSNEVTSPVLKICELDICFMSRPVLAKVLSLYLNVFPNDPEELSIVFGDADGDRISATVRSTLVSKFMKRIKEGEWYIFSDFEVTTKSQKRKWTDHYLHIYFHPDTKCDKVTKHPTTTRFAIQKFKAIHDGSISKLTNVVDLIGGIIKVERMRIKEADGDDCFWTNERKVVTFYLQNWDGDKLKCFAIDNFAEEFEHMWLSNDREQLVFCEMRFWDVDVDGNGEFSVHAKRDYSKIKFLTTEAITAKYHQMNGTLNQWIRFEDDYDENNNFKYPPGFYHPYY